MTAAAFAGGIGVALVSAPGIARAELEQTPVRLDVGDAVVVSGAPIGCRVARRDGRKTLDCRRIDALAGTYGALLDTGRVRVVRFESRQTARVVFVARHRSAATRTCG